LTTGALVGWQGGPSIQLAPVTVIANTAWPYAAGDRSGANAAQAVYVDNTLGTTSVLVKPEKCEDQFDVVLPGSKRLGAIDGIKPPAWLVSGQPAYSQDWYKVINNVGVRINSDGTPTAFAPTFLSISLLLIPDCNFDGNCRSAPGDFLYQHSGGRKLEPEWSQDVPPWHWDWRYPGPSVAVRIQRCAAAK
jgi:hypothetical protein